MCSCGIHVLSLMMTVIWNCSVGVIYAELATQTSGRRCCCARPQLRGASTGSCYEHFIQQCFEYYGKCESGRGEPPSSAPLPQPSSPTPLSPSASLRRGDRLQYETGLQARTRLSRGTGAALCSATEPRELVPLTL